MKLYPKDYVAPEESTKVIVSESSVQTAIKTYVKEPKTYESIIKEIQKKYSMTNDEIQTQIEVVRKEWESEKAPVTGEEDATIS